MCVCVTPNAGGKAGRKQASIMLIESACWCVMWGFFKCLLKCTRVCLLEGVFQRSLKFAHTELTHKQAVDPRQIIERRDWSPSDPSPTHLSILKATLPSINLVHAKAKVMYTKSILLKVIYNK